MRIRNALIGLTAAAVLAGPAATAHASSSDRDCLPLMGPAYVADAVDCVRTIVAQLSNYLPPIG